MATALYYTEEGEMEEGEMEEGAHLLHTVLPPIVKVQKHIHLSLEILL